MVKRKKKKKAKRKAKKKGKKKPFGGYHIRPDAHLAKIIGKKPVTPSLMTKKIWQYIKKKKLARK
jgi:chromatin remodeling complex protein RSC6